VGRAAADVEAEQRVTEVETRRVQAAAARSPRRLSPSDAKTGSAEARPGRPIRGRWRVTVVRRGQRATRNTDPAWRLAPPPSARRDSTPRVQVGIQRRIVVHLELAVDLPEASPRAALREQRVEAAREIVALQREPLRASRGTRAM
jgi:hypothetical protein